MIPGACGILAVVLVAGTAGAAPPTATLDVVDVQRIGDELLAIRGGGTPTRVRLETREKLLWKGARGTIGVALTDRRFLAVSTRSSGWQEFRLRRSEPPHSSVELGANVALLLAPQRLVTFDGLSALLTEQRLGPQEQLLDSGANEHVALAVTSRRAIGLASRLGEPSEIPLLVHEDYEESSLLGTTATVRTSRRLLVFRSATGTWTVEQLPLH